MPKQLKLVHLVTLLCLSVFVLSTHGYANQHNGLLKVYFFDIGQGDAIFIETPGGSQILVDGGPDNKILSKLGGVMPFYDRDLDAVIVSHPHADHIAGLVDVFKRYNVKNIIEAEESYNSPEFKAWTDAVRNEKTKETEATAGKIIEIGDGARITILHPFESVAGTETKTPHDDNVVAMLQYGSLKVLLTGDMEEKVERHLIMAGENLDADVLKIGHHGSKTSTSEEFLSAVSPEIAVIQVGVRNRYGHPSSEVLNRLGNFGIKYYRNDLDGDIKLVSDGNNFQVIKN